MASEASTQVLFNIDLLREIFQNLESGPKLQLLALALTCRAFAEPAQDSLWKTMSSLVPFLSLIPGLVTNAKWEIVHFEAPSDNKPLLDYPRFHAQAVRLQHYKQAPLVKDHIKWMSNICLLRLVELKGPGPLFPALRRLSYPEDAMLTQHVALFTKSPITSFSVQHDLIIPSRIRALQPVSRAQEAELVLTTRKESLKELVLCTTGAPLAKSTLKAVGLLTSLTSLTLSVINPAPGQLSGLQCLEILRIKAPQTFILGVLLGLPSKKLTEATLVRTDRGSRGWWAQNPDGSEGIQPPSFWHACAQVIQDRWKTTLTSLCIDDAMSPDPFDPFEFRSLASILYPIECLETLELGSLSTRPVCITDDDYDDIAQAWPLLRTLHIHLPYTNPQIFGGQMIFSSSVNFFNAGGPRMAPMGTPGLLFGQVAPQHNFFNPPPYSFRDGPPQPPPHPTARALLTLATHCIYLESLQIYLPDVGDPSLVQGFEGQTSLRKLWLGNCKVTDASATAMQLHLLFPKLQTVAGVIPTPGSSNPVAGSGSACGFEWMSVRAWLTHVRNIRIAERSRIMGILEQEGVFLPGKVQKRIY